jgi:hypothetical protein
MTLPNPSNLRESIDGLARLIGNSTNFQELVRKYSEEEAAAHIHKVVASNAAIILPADLPRPWALIEIGDYNAHRIAGGERNCFDGEGWLTLTFASELADLNDPGGSTIDFADWCYAVLSDICELAGYDDHLNVADLEQEQPPVFSGPFSGDEIPWIEAAWRIRWSRF